MGTAVTVVGLVLAAGGCTQSDPGPSAGGAAPRAVAVTSTEDGCDLSADSAPAGTLTFTVSNEGAEVTEFYVLDETGGQVLGEVENVGPGLSRDLVVALEEGTYTASCKPGMAGEGVSSVFTVEAGSD
ncbi:cupredoxin domain-containing protein [Nocardioides anomalus]|uniref:cupredoxin domain-containing protein n=1 Tax=Nocardioides anomalus TaxID=2712223 RepID=UPI001E517116|nr:cupredoxin domain-containing protein [Nocardioides anomalus]